jgi:phosphoesterase RecJ-like protein
LRSPSGEFDLISVVDCSDLARAGEALENYPAPHLNIDHHITNEEFAAVNLVDTSAVATAELLADLMPSFGLAPSQPVASALLTGLITDTLGFRTGNMTPKAMHLAAELMERGADLPELYRRSLIRRSFEAARYWGEGLVNLERQGRMVWVTLSLQDRKAAGYPGRDDADLINILSAIEETDIALIFVEQSNQRTKVSWRAQPGFDVSQTALQFGGGGHPAAAGAEIDGSLEDVRARVLQATKILLNGKLPTG